MSAGTDVDSARRLLKEAKRHQQAGELSAALDKLWSAVDWLCDAVESVDHNQESEE